MSFPFLKYRKYKKFCNTGKFDFAEHNNLFFGGRDFFIFQALVLKVAQVVVYITTHTTWKLSLSLEQRFSYIDKREYKDIFFEVLRECTTWTSRDGAVQIFFSETNHKYFCRKMCKMSVFFGCVAGLYFSQCWVSWGS